MADILSRGNLFPEILVPNLVNLVRGHSALAKLCGASPIAFNGQREFTFTLDKEVDIVAENGAKTKGGATVNPVTIVPIKFEYGARVSDEFKYGSEEVRLQYLMAFTEGFARKLARGLDIAAFSGVNPRTGVASAVIGNNSFEGTENGTATPIIQHTSYDPSEMLPDDALDDAIAGIVENGEHPTGIAMSPYFALSLGGVRENVDMQAQKVSGAFLYPEFRFGGRPDSFAGMTLDVNDTVTRENSTTNTTRAVIVGDFANAFKWGYAKQIPLEVIEYGNPDNDATLGDLKGHNQVYLRAEAYIGWGILNPNAFVVLSMQTGG